MRHALGIGVIPQDAPFPQERRAVVEQQGGTGGQTADQPVPHHPAQGREIEQPVIRLEIGMQLLLDQMLDQAAAGTMHNALGHACGTRGIQDVERMIEGQLLEHQWLRHIRRKQLLQAQCRRTLQVGGISHRGRSIDGRGIQPGVGNDHRQSQPRQARDNLAQLGQAVDEFAVVPIALHCEQDFRLDLSKAVHHALHTEVRGTG